MKNKPNTEELEKAVIDAKTYGADLYAVDEFGHLEKSTLPTLYDAAQYLLTIMDDLDEMIEAREKATGGEWVRNDGFVVDDKGIIMGKLDDKIGEYLNNKFITTAANAIARIAEKGE